MFNLKINFLLILMDIDNISEHTKYITIYKHSLLKKSRIIINNDSHIRIDTFLNFNIDDFCNKFNFSIDNTFNNNYINTIYLHKKPDQSSKVISSKVISS